MEGSADERGEEGEGSREEGDKNRSDFSKGGTRFGGAGACSGLVGSALEAHKLVVFPLRSLWGRPRQRWAGKIKSK